MLSIIEQFLKKKKRVLIFGAGSGGINFFKKNRNRFYVIGFVDNDIKKHGSLILRRRVYSPSQIGLLNFDKIIIASDYYKSIYEQLVNENGIDSEKIEIFFYSNMSGRSLLEIMLDYIELNVLELACNNDGIVSNFAFKIFNLISGESLRRLRIEWLDENKSNKIHVFRPSESSAVYGPNYIGRPVSIESILLPEIGLFRFHNAEVKSVSRFICFSNDKIVIERVPTAESKHADYRSSKLRYHGDKYALVRDETLSHLTKGILINGFSDTNYYHLMLEVISQIQFVRELPVEIYDHPILLSQQCQSIPSIRSFLEYILPQRDIIYLNSTSSYIVDDLLYINMPNALVPNLKPNVRNNVKNSYVRFESLNFLRSIAYEMCNVVISESSHKRIFLGRKPGLRNYNQEEIVNTLLKYGFICVFLEDLEFNQQVNIMANAEIIIGPTGAAWTNIIFAKENAKALCWMAEEAGDLSCFSNLAAAFNVDMHYRTYPAGTTDSRELYSRNYYMSVENITKWLDNVIVKERKPTLKSHKSKIAEVSPQIG